MNNLEVNKKTIVLEEQGIQIDLNINYKKIIMNHENTAFMILSGIILFCGVIILFAYPLN